MKRLGKQIITTVRSGSYQLAVVESINYGMVTIRLGSSGTGARLTNLHIVGPLPSVGDIVTVDYSSGTPYVRVGESQQAATNELELAVTPLELSSQEEAPSYILSDPYSLANQEASGHLAYMNTAGTCSFGTPVYAASGGVTPAYATGIATAKVIAMAAQYVGSGNSGTFLVDGFIRNTSWSFTAGGYIFLSTGGGITQTKPTGTDECVVILGTALTSDIIRFKPELVIVELA